ncbi:substrate-binding protein [Vibrio sp. TRT 17S01]|uniref:substrate-binding protein n=1 Tax=Vibrio sp. TRT 17S01 TaxID=3418505 RepID=UPI003CFAFBD2
MKKWVPNRPLFVAFICVFLFSCSPAKEPIKVGVVLPLTGTFAVYGQQALKGAQLAVDQINAQGGVLGRPLSLIVKDNQTDPAKTVAFSRELVQVENVFALLGPVSSSSRYAMSEIADEFKTPMLYGIDYEGRHFSRYLICYSTIPEHYITPVVPYLTENVGDKFYIFGYDYIWPHKMSEHIVEEVDRNHGQVTNVEFTAFGVENYQPVFQRIKDSGAQTLMLILPGADGFQFLSQMANFDFGRNIQVVAFAADETYLSNVDSAALNGVLTALHFFNELDTSTAQKFVEDYRKFHGYESVVTYSSKSHYDLMFILKKAIEASGEFNKETTVNQLQNITLYDGDAKVSLRVDHHFNLPMYLGQFNNGDLTVIKNLGIITPQDQRNIVDE